MDFKQIKELIKIVNDSQIGEIKIEEKDFKIAIRHREYHPKISVGAAPVASAQPVVTVSEAPQAKPETTDKNDAETTGSTSASQEDTSHLITVKSPMIGTFYRASSPDKPPYVKVGDQVSKDDVLCIIEAMKLFNEIESEISGTVVKVLVENQSPVEYDQPLFLIDPKG